MTTVGPRGRVTIPAAVQREAGISEGDEVIIRADGPGVVVVETRGAVIKRIREGFEPLPESETFDAQAELRKLRGRGESDS